MLFYGAQSQLAERRENMEQIQIDQVIPAPDSWTPPQYQTTLADSFEVNGPATYQKGNHSTLVFEPMEEMEGWWISRSDQTEQLPIRVFTGNVWNARRNIVLRSGSQHNYLRMTEHIIAHRLGLGVDNAVVTTGTGDPPLFDVGSIPIVEAIKRTGLKTLTDRPIVYRTVKEPVAILGPYGSFLEFSPEGAETRKLTLDVAIDFPTIIGKQRIVFDLTPETFSFGAQARTNCSRKQMFLAKTFGLLFADTRNLGYTRTNILVAGKTKYVNKPLPELILDGKPLEAVWHRACLDLIAALSLIDYGRLCGRITSYKSGHSLDCRLMNLIYINKLLTTV